MVLRSKNKTIRWIVLNDERPKRKRRADRRGNPENGSDARMDCHVALRAPRNDSSGVSTFAMTV
jgi:hypothetical protein